AFDGSGSRPRHAAAGRPNGDRSTGRGAGKPFRGRSRSRAGRSSHAIPQMTSLAERIASLSSAKRELLTRRLDALAPIAIVGIGCRFPGACGPKAFWELVLNVVGAIRDLPAERRRLRAVFEG